MTVLVWIRVRVTITLRRPRCFCDIDVKHHPLSWRLESLQRTPLRFWHWDFEPALRARRRRQRPPALQKGYLD